MSDKVLNHRNYSGSIEISIEDGCLHGEILFINDLVSYEAENVRELQTAFEDAVDVYLDKCQREGLEPDKPCSGTFNVRLTPELHRNASLAAARKGQSLNDFVKDCVSDGVSATSKDPGSTPRSSHLRPVTTKSHRSAK
ncbi:type II toxin-antitoxin system HicB family antitoxin [Collimonas sp.]|jgi:predicted HicB family RNase H-like nuclease|uniref:type II toxin-antitoxin system HicB family antitoxin n=1 Tax=Collimonas sp. TaxID=1963772 RepID=UPI002C9CAB85|nr:type II toxin-antitoxin system HicB family antitoxin [Collimonas sp.]HWW06502.1 type II toxin-antitoxin system HicB family antitoxin [Collimonas sp.]